MGGGRGRGERFRWMVVIAHPDDECMFFGPTLLRLAEDDRCGRVGGGTLRAPAAGRLLTGGAPAAGSRAPVGDAGELSEGFRQGSADAP